MGQYVNYIVMPEHRLVVCEIRDRFGNKYRAKAKCGEIDVFDEEKGKRISYLRADNKRKRANIRFMNDNVIKELRFQISYMEDEIRKLEKRIERTRMGIAKNSEEILLTGTK